MTERAILTVYWYGMGSHYHWLMAHKHWTVTTMLLWGMRYRK